VETPAAQRVTAAATSASPAAPQVNAQVSATDGKHCTWCGAYSPQDAKRCVSCDATFPTPEGDEALERAAQARIKAMEGDLQQQRQRGWWPFRSR
jgi:ribosomal protein L40E